MEHARLTGGIMIRLIGLIAVLGALDLGVVAIGDNNNYPDSWWEPVPRDQAASWEILPQDAGEGEVILSKRTELGIFSNFAPTRFRLDRRSYASMEGFWQAMKYPENRDDPRAQAPGADWPYTRYEVTQLTGFDAKRAGSYGSDIMEQLGINWVTYKNRRMTYRTSDRGDHYKLIRRAMWAKLNQNPEVKELLLQTGSLVLRPDHNQGDSTPPAWKYHEIWMEIRSELQSRSGS